MSKAGEKDDERVIELREGANEQVIQAELRQLRGNASQPSPSQGASSSGVNSSIMPGIVACTNCKSRFAEGVKFCGRCGNRSFALVSEGDEIPKMPCPRCQSPLPQNSKFCGRCGLHLTQSASVPDLSSRGFSSGYPPSPFVSDKRTCPRCRGQFSSNIKFCGKCGYSLN